MNRAWREAEHSNHFYYSMETGLIQAHVFKIGQSYTIYNAKVYFEGLDRIIGSYIELEYAKKAVETWWLQQEITLLENT